MVGMQKGLTLVLHSIGLTNISALAGLKRTKLNATQPCQQYLQKVIRELQDHGEHILTWWQVSVDGE